MSRYAWTEIWTDLQCAGGSRLAKVPDVVALPDMHRLSGDDGLTLTLPVSSPTWTYVRARRVARVVASDGSFEEWRILRIGKSRANGVQPATIECVSVLADLGRALVTRTEADGLTSISFEALQLTPSQHLSSFILPALAAQGMTWLSAGTIDPTTPRDLVYERLTPLAALQQIAELSTCELQIRRNGTTGYYIDILTAIGASAPTFAARLGKNLIGVQWTDDASEQATRMYGSGEAEDGIHATIAGARWVVAAVSGNDITLADPAGGAGPIGFDDQLNTLYLRKPAGTYTQITDSAEATQVATVASGSGLTMGDIVTIHASSSGADLTFLDAPSAIADYGIFSRVLDRPEIPGTINLLPNPALRAWSAGLPDAWTILGSPTVTETTTAGRWQAGGKSARVQSSADGEGLELEVAVDPTTGRPYFTGSVSFYLASGRVRVQLVASDGVTTTLYPDGTNGQAYSTKVDVWDELIVAGIDLNEIGATTCAVRIVQDGSGTADFYVDAAQLTQTDQRQPFFDGAGPTALWQAVNEALRVDADPRVDIRVSLADLHAAHPTAFPNDALVLGGQVRVQDETLGIDVTTRIIEVGRDLARNMNTTVALSNRPEDLTDLLTRPRRAKRQQPAVTPWTYRAAKARVTYRISHADLQIKAVDQADYVVSDAEVRGVNGANVGIQGRARFPVPKGARVVAFRIRLKALGATNGVSASVLEVSGDTSTTLDSVAHATAGYATLSGALDVVAGDNNIALSVVIGNNPFVTGSQDCRFGWAEVDADQYIPDVAK